ncbi:MAG: nitronate monooxygenase [Bdellovibrionota bacterium]
MNKLCEKLNIEVPIFCGAMYPCSNPELVAAASEAGAIGIVQPLSLTYVHGYKFREGLRYIRTLTQKPIGVNLLIENSSEIYIQRMKNFMEISREEGVRFFITALGNPKWFVEKIHAQGGLVFHDVTERKWALVAQKADVDGLICVNSLAGGHSGTLLPQELYNECKDLGLPLVCAGGVGDEKKFKYMLDIGYEAVQMGTRFLATEECKVAPEYKNAIVNAHASDIVHTEKLTGVPIAVINNEYVKRIGQHASTLSKFLLKNNRTKHWIRMFYSLISLRGLKLNIKSAKGRDYYWQAGKSVEGIHKIERVADIIQKFKSELKKT